MTERIRGRQLQRLREQKKRDNPLCPKCQAEGIVREWDELDHTIPVTKGGTNDCANLVGLCRDHHRTKTLAEFGLRDRSRGPTGIDGWPA